MHSPLPDSSALEAGIIEDEMPSRLSRVQENVRNLLRNSSIGLASSSPPVASPSYFNQNHGLPTPPHSPRHRASQQQHQYVPNPLAEHPPSTTTSTPSTEADEISDADVPPSHYRHTVQQMAHQSALFNTRAVAALDHPDLSDPSLAAHLRKVHDQQRRAWKRSRHGQKRRRAADAGSSPVLFCILTALLLAATVATYIVLATTSKHVTAAFHILFILGIILATVVFAHSLMRLLVLGDTIAAKRRVTTPARLRHKHRHRPRSDESNTHQHHRPRTMPESSSNSNAFIPATPIPVHMPADAVRPDSREARPTTTITLTEPSITWDKPADDVPNPPPAYGRWRGSVRADPELLHWQVLPSPVQPLTPGLPSPTYEEAVARDTARPPSYVTRDSPARRRGGDASPTGGMGYQAPTAEPEPEMIEVSATFGMAM